MDATKRNPASRSDVPEAALAPEFNSELNSEPWHVFIAKVRIDAFHRDALVGQLREAQAAGNLQIGLDLRATRFISLQAIQFITQFAIELRQAGGRLALIAPIEKTKRHFEIYGSLDRIEIFRSGADMNVVSSKELAVAEAAEPGAISVPVRPEGC